MGAGFYYVYALKDPRKHPAVPFYIGKGVGSRSDQHLLRLDDSPKSRRIKEIRSAGLEPHVGIMVDELTEAAAIKLEAELIAAFGIATHGGLLTNLVLPSGKRSKIRAGIVVPSGALERAQIALSLLRAAVLDLVRANPSGLSNGDVTNALGLQSDYRGGSINYLAYSVLGLLLREGLIVRTGARNAQRHVTAAKR